MDKTKEYIKMCDCSEIQKQRKGVDKNSWYQLSNYGICCGNNFSTWSIWLPRQDQIQEMMMKDYKNTLDMLCDFYAVITVDQPTGFQQMFEVSMEQLWLVFYMWKKYNKVWKNKGWTDK